MDVQLIKAFTHGLFNPWPTDGRYSVGTSDSVEVERPAKVEPSGSSRLIIGWDLGRVVDPSAVVLLEAATVHSYHEPYTRRIEWDFHHGFKRCYTTAFYRVIGAQEWRNDDYLNQVDRLRAIIDSLKPEFPEPVLCFDGGGVGIAVSELTRSLQAVCRVVPMTITGGGNYNFREATSDVSIGKSRLLMDIRQVVLQGRIKAPGQPQNEAAKRLREQLNEIRIDDKFKNLITQVDERSNASHHFDLSSACSLAISWCDRQAAKFTGSFLLA